MLGLKTPRDKKILKNETWNNIEREHDPKNDPELDPEHEHEPKKIPEHEPKKIPEHDPGPVRATETELDPEPEHDKEYQNSKGFTQMAIMKKIFHTNLNPSLYFGNIL